MLSKINGFMIELYDYKFNSDEAILSKIRWLPKLTRTGVDMGMQGWDLIGRALKDFNFLKDPGISLKVHSNCSGTEILPAEVFFRDESGLPELERYALDLCQGRVLDVGAGAGCHSLILQGRGIQVTAADISHDAVKVMEERGLSHVIEVDVNSWETGDKFDTILMLMNGIGLVGDLDGLNSFLNHVKAMITPGGQLLLDSTDFTLFPEFMNTWGAAQLRQGRYFGEVEYRIEYQGLVSEAYSWLFVDYKTLIDYAHEAGWFCQIIFEEEGQYLARLTRHEE